MTFIVRELPKARQDKESIFRWLDERSPTGALAWLEAYDSLLDRLELDASTCAVAPENEDCDFEVRQALFKTRHGRVYRALFFIEGEQVFILRVRGPGQSPVMPPRSWGKKMMPVPFLSSATIVKLPAAHCAA